MISSLAQDELAKQAQVKLTEDQKQLYFDFSRIERTLSWAIVGGGWQRHDGCLWVRVTDQDLRPPVDATAYLQNIIERQHTQPKLGLLTSARLEDFVDERLSYGDISVRTVLTAGLSNALRVGDSPGPSGRIGTINIVTQVSRALSHEASIEAMAIQTEAKAAAMLAKSIPSYRSPALATGTGTDCQVISSPEHQRQEKYAGKHTKLGYLIGESVYQALCQGIDKWSLRYPNHPLLKKREDFL
ncbi:MAG: adenosylcobinamide amidohydrolase [Oligoflexus sp.]